MRALRGVDCYAKALLAGVLLAGAARAQTPPRDTAAERPAPVKTATEKPDSGTAPDRVRAVEEPPEFLRWRPPAYPENLRRNGIVGRVVLRFTIDTLGRVEPNSVGVVSSPNAEFSEAAIAALRTARFKPARINGKAVPADLRMPVNFSLHGGPVRPDFDCRRPVDFRVICS